MILELYYVGVDKFQLNSLETSVNRNNPYPKQDPHQLTFKALCYNSLNTTGKENCFPSSTGCGATDQHIK